MAITPIYTGPNMNFPRSYIAGFVGSAGVTNMRFVGEILRFDYLAPLILVDLVIKHKFFVPTSNVYSLDYVFDFAASQVYVSGTPVAAGVGVQFRAMSVESTFRLQVLSTLSLDEAQTVDLAAVPGYWLPPN
jgi:hypothetical protein